MGAGNLRYRTWYLGLVRSYGAASLSIYLSIRPRMSSALSAPASKSVRIRMSVRERQRENLAGRLAWQRVTPSPYTVWTLGGAGAFAMTFADLATIACLAASFFSDCAAIACRASSSAAASSS